MGWWVCGRVSGWVGDINATSGPQLKSYKKKLLYRQIFLLLKKFSSARVLSSFAIFEHATIAGRSYKRVGHTVRHLCST